MALPRVSKQVPGSGSRGRVCACTRAVGVNAFATPTDKTRVQAVVHVINTVGHAVKARARAARSAPRADASAKGPQSRNKCGCECTT
jgi:hypothetical protein